MSILDSLKNYNFSSKEKVMESIQAECRRQGIGSNEQVAYVLATVKHETNNTFKPVREAYWLSEGWRQRNLRYYPYYGRGYVQITWQENYRKFSDILSIDLVNHPDRVMEEPISLFILVYGFKNGTFTRKKITDYINDSKTDFPGARYCINGTDKRQTIANYAQEFLRQLPLPSVEITPVVTSELKSTSSQNEVRRGNFSVRLQPSVTRTAIKYSPVVQATDINDPNLKFDLNLEERLEIAWFDDIASHYKFELETPLKGRYIWYAFDQHVEIFDDEKDCPVGLLEAGSVGEEFPNIDVPYFSQRDNKIRAHQTCNMTCSAMVVKFYYPDLQSGANQLEDTMTQYCVNNWGTDAIYFHDKIVKTLAHWKVKSEFSTVTPFSKIKEHLVGGNPVIYSGKFTSSGHIIVLRGFDETGFWVNDPWGEWFSRGYQNSPGRNLHYSFNMMSRLSYSGMAAGWAHLCTKM